MALPTLARVLIVCLFQGVSSLDESYFYEKCPSPMPVTTPDFDMNWFMSIRMWYYTPISKLELFRSAADVQNVTLGSLREEDVYYDGCVAVQWPEDPKKDPTYTSMGKKVHFFVKPTGPPLNGMHFEFQNYDAKGNTTMPLTDNKTYMTFFSCYEDGSGSWAMMNISPRPDPAVLKKFIDFGEAHGLDRKNLVLINYDHCKSVDCEVNEC